VEREGGVCSCFVLALELSSPYERARLQLTPAEPDDLADSLSFALRREGRKSQHDSDKLNADIVAQRLVRHLDRARYVVMKKPPLGGTLRLRGGLVRSD